jgi:alkylhydroperoxidase/carboxymuconolactone decarboxylase family protein YurZ
MTEAEAVLRRLSAGDERVLRSILAPTPEFDAVQPAPGLALDRRLRVLVRLAALVAVGAPTTSLRWAIDLASAAGVSDEALVAVLVRAGSAAGWAQVVSSASRLGLAMGLELDAQGCDAA